MLWWLYHRWWLRTINAKRLCYSRLAIVFRVDLSVQVWIELLPRLFHFTVNTFAFVLRMNCKWNSRQTANTLLHPFKWQTNFNIYCDFHQKRPKTETIFWMKYLQRHNIISSVFFLQITSMNVANGKQATDKRHRISNNIKYAFKWFCVDRHRQQYRWQ